MSKGLSPNRKGNYAKGSSKGMGKNTTQQATVAESANVAYYMPWFPVPVDEQECV